MSDVSKTDRPLAEVVAELHALDAKAKRGPWEWDEEDGVFHAGEKYGAGLVFYGQPTADGNHPIQCEDEDARLVVAMRNALPELLAAADKVAVLEARIEAAHKELAEAFRDWDADRDAKVGKRIGNAAEILKPRPGS